MIIKNPMQLKAFIKNKIDDTCNTIQTIIDAIMV